jgi:exopolysaccharide production protein ExoZ
MIVNVQVLRAFAASVVVFYHVQAMIKASADLQQSYLHFPAAGVDVFFVISGFIMFRSTRAFKRTTVEFWIDRIVRIVPMYWLTTLTLVMFYLGGRHPNGVHRLDAGDVVSALLFIPDIRADGLKEPVLSSGWTLIYEMYFYFVFGLTFFMRSHLKSFVAVALVFAAVVTAGAAFGPFSYAVDYFCNPIVFEFLAGCALALDYPHLKFSSTQSARTIGYALIIGGVGVIGLSDWYAYGAFQNWSIRLLVYGIPAWAIVAGALILEQAGFVWKNRALSALGSASYSLYLVHPLVMQPVSKVFHFIAATFFPSPLFDGPSPSVLNWIFAGAITPVIIVAGGIAGLVAYRWIERPIENYYKRWSRRSPAVATKGAPQLQTAPTDGER